MMIVCREDDSTSRGEQGDKAFFVDECSMGEPYTEFGKWFDERYCRGPSMMDQMRGIKEHNWLKLTGGDVAAILWAAGNLKTHDKLNVKELHEYITAHVDKHISTENW